jgi:glycosyltransferase involved in cell wall biosynthesis
VKLAVVVQRYGLAISGGAELHARYIAEHLARHADVEVLTTCAVDYVTWRNELPAGVERVNGIPVRRFRVDRERDTSQFARLSQLVFTSDHSVADELEWLDAEGPASASLIRHLVRHAADFDQCIFFSYRYHHAFHGVRAAGGRAMLVPTAERDHAIGLSIFPSIFRGVRALMYNSPEERAMIHAVSGNQQVPSVVVGTGSEIPANPQPGRFRQKFNLHNPFAVYVGRIDENKGCKELFEFFDEYLRTVASSRLSLVLIGHAQLPIPKHPRIRHLGVLDDSDKFDALAASELLIMPSYLESLSMVALEAWALGKPVLANAKCDVLKGQSIRSNAGLYYDERGEFIEALRAIEQNRWLAVALGRSGRQFYRENYDWPVVERRYFDMIRRLQEEPPRAPMPPVPGWFARRQRNCRPAADVVSGLPSGAAIREQSPGLEPVAAVASGVRPVERAPAPERRPFNHRRDRRPHHGGRSPRTRGA